jgi:hypothetical protein
MFLVTINVTEDGMKKIFPLLLVLVMLVGCSKKLRPDHVISNINDTITDSIQLVTRLDTGMLYILFALEANTNMSSLFIDKTKEKVTSFHATSHEVLPKGKAFYIIPTQVTRDGKTFYDEESGRLIRNYIHLSGFGKVTPYIQNADYVIISRIKESIDRGHFKNDSTIVMNIMHKNDIPAFSSVIKLESKADSNFWYFPTKNAIPSNMLSIKGLGQIFAVALPQAFGIDSEPSTLDKFEAKMAERAEARKEARAAKDEYKEIIEAEEKGAALREKTAKQTN